MHLPRLGIIIPFMGMKTFGLADMLRVALKPLEKHVVVVFIYGLIAKHPDLAYDVADIPPSRLPLSRRHRPFTLHRVNQLVTGAALRISSISCLPSPSHSDITSSVCSPNNGALRTGT